MPIDPAMLATSIATLTDLDPERDLASTLEQAIVAAKELFELDAAGIMLADADGRLRWASASDPLARTWRTTRKPWPLAPACKPSPAASQRSCTTSARRLISLFKHSGGLVDQTSRSTPSASTAMTR